jgi:hypothetical protein
MSRCAFFNVNVVVQMLLAFCRVMTDDGGTYGGGSEAWEGWVKATVEHADVDGMTRMLTALLLTMATGCATATSVMGPDGTPHVAVHCGNKVDCLSKAQEACPRGYTMVSESRGQDPIAPTALGPVGGAPNFDLLIKCGAPVAATR